MRVLWALVLTSSSAAAFRSVVCHPQLRSTPQVRALRVAAVAASEGRVSEAYGQRTFDIIEKISQADESGGAGSSINREVLLRMDKAWEAVKGMSDDPAAAGPAPQFVREVETPLPSPPTFDVAVAGGTLGMFVATALQRKGFKVCVVERGPLKGRSQEWNISMKELKELVKFDVLDEEDLKAAIAIEFNPIRVGFTDERGKFELLTEDILNLGVFPNVLLERARARFEAAGGVVRENAPVKAIRVAPNGAAIELLQGGGEEITSRLVLDCMGNQSPISRQARWGQKPDGVCIVVGTCASGFNPANNTYADLLYSDTPIMQARSGKSAVQYFWEAFPASSGPGDRTTYLFQYCDAKPERPSILDCFEDYWALLPKYQGVKLEDLTFKRAVCNWFPTYKTSPLKTPFDRVCAIGDASGIQSPLSFGGFGSLSRHLPRLLNAVTEALETDSLTKEELGLINEYQPSLSTTWLFQRAMSVPVGAEPKPDFINKALINNFMSMVKLGDPVLRPFLQDVVQAGPLGLAMGGITLNDPLNTPAVILHVGPAAFFPWFLHFFNLCLYTLMHTLFKSTKGTDVLPPKARYRWNRLLELWQWGSGLDYRLE